MFTRKLPLIFSLVASLFFFPAIGHSETYSTLSFDDDQTHQIQIEHPSDWEKVENEGDYLHDLKFINPNGNKFCLLFFGLLETSVATQEDLCDAGEQILEEYYARKVTENHEISFNSNVYWNAFESQEDNEPTFNAIAVYSIKNYLFGIFVSNKIDKATLISDCNYFIDKISLHALD
jgi:hypothetical protein